LESICGIAESISLERKQMLVPAVEWDIAVDKLEKRKRAQKEEVLARQNELINGLGGNLVSRGAVLASSAEEKRRKEQSAKARRQLRACGFERAYEPELRDGKLWATGSEPQRRYKRYVAAAKQGRWTREGATFLPIDGWKTGAWVEGSRTQRSGSHLDNRGSKTMNRGLLSEDGGLGAEFSVPSKRASLSNGAKRMGWGSNSRHANTN
jgi:hypothetical protein